MKISVYFSFAKCIRFMTYYLIFHYYNKYCHYVSSTRTEPEASCTVDKCSPTLKIIFINSFLP